MQTIIPNIWTNRSAQAAAEFYATALSTPAVPVTVDTLTRYPDTGLMDGQQEFAGEVLTADILLGDYRMTLINAGDEFRPNVTISFLLNFDERTDPEAATHLRGVWDRLLAADGAALMPLQEYSFSPLFGWVVDRYGVSWQLMLAGEDHTPPAYVMPALMCAGPAANRGAEAIDYYTATFPNSEQGRRKLWEQSFGTAEEGSVLLAEFGLAGQWFMVNDAAEPQPEVFGCGVSFAVLCADQEETDYYWQRLSTVPEAEQCGWCVDQFGLSWQIVPAAMDELMTSPGSYPALMGMGKIDIEALRRA